MKQDAKEVVKILINPFEDRDNIVGILGRNGYKVWVEEKEREYPLYSNDYWVCYEIKNTRPQAK